jgi:hypothetical protein
MKRKSIAFNKSKTFLILVAVALAVSLLLACSRQPENGYQTFDSINELQESPSEGTIETLRALIEDPELDPYLRERAIFVLTDVSISLERNSEIRDYLKEIALDQGMPSGLQSAALAGVDFMDELFPPEKHGMMHVDVRGEIRPGSQIAIIVALLSDIDVENAEVYAGVNKLYSLAPGAQVVDDPIITPIGDPYDWKGTLEADTLKEIRFDFKIEQEGEIELPVSYKFTFDEIDYELEEQSLYFAITSTGGEFYRAEDSQTDIAG